MVIRVLHIRHQAFCVCAGDPRYAAQKPLLEALNPVKFRLVVALSDPPHTPSGRVCEYLVRIHEQRGDKILVFCDNLHALRLYAETLARPIMDGSTSSADRLVGQCCACPPDTHGA